MTAIDVWGAVAERLDPTTWRPAMAGDVECNTIENAAGPDVVIATHPRADVHVRLSPAEAALLPSIDGSRSLAELAVDDLTVTGGLDPAALAGLVVVLRRRGFLTEPWVDVSAALERALTRPRSWRERVRAAVRTQSIEWKGAEGLVRLVYRAGARALFTPVGLVLAACLALAGLGAAIASWSTTTVAPGRVSAVGEFVVLLSLNALAVAFHEMGHALVLVHHGRRVHGAGFRIYFGAPAFFVDASDALMLTRRQRIVQSAAGVFGDCLLAAPAVLYVWAVPGGVGHDTVAKWAILNYFTAAMNLVPMLELDGYWILSDALRQPDLRRRSLRFMRRGLWRKLRTRQPWTRPDVGLVAYGTIGVAFTVVIVAGALRFWIGRASSIVGALVDGGAVGWVLLVIAGFVVGAPLVGGLVALTRALTRRAAARARTMRFRLQTGWRVDAAELLDEAGVFGDLPVDTLNEIAGVVTRRAFADGQAVFHQGDASDAYYIVRSGRFEVVDDAGASAPGGDGPVLRSLTRGDGFGELGLLDGRARSATVRAIGRGGEVYVVDGGTFQRALARRANADELTVSLQQAAELSAMPCFRHLDPRQAIDLYAAGSWVNVPPGTEVVTEGEPGDAFYAVASGRLEVEIAGRTRRELGPGAWFGELALLHREPRSATVRAVTPARLFRLPADGFDRWVGGAFRSGVLHPATPEVVAWGH